MSSIIDSILVDNSSFSNYGLEHLLCFTACILFIICIIYYAKNHWNTDQQRLYITLICTFGAFTQLFKLWYRYHIGTIDISEDLPLHLCNIMVLIMPPIMWFKSRQWWAITFFLIIAGCAQSIFTPTLTESMPNYEAVRYWAVHTIIILGALYGLIVYDYSLTWKDAIKSFIFINVVAAIIYPINIAIGSNYIYLNAKPAGKTFYDLLGEWPGYIVSLEIILIVVYMVMVFPFYLMSQRKISK